MLQRTPDPLLARLQKYHAPKYAAGKHPNTLANLKLGKFCGKDVWKCAIKVPERGQPIIRRLYEIINEKKMPISTVSRRSGVNRKLFDQWRSGCNASLNNVIAVAQVLGYDVVLKKRRGAK